MAIPSSRSQAGQGQMLGRYRLRGLLSQGGMGRLYIAEQEGIEGFSKVVAVKQILPHLADSPQFRKMFLNEARVAARLQHPNIVVTYELGEAEGLYYIAMEYLPGEDLGAALARGLGPIPEDIGAVIAHQALGGLQYAHELRDTQGHPAGLVHRDVNPSNIFLTYHGMVKLLDFGVVKGATTVTTPGTFKGRYGYCAPEQLEGDEIDARTDVFCVGIVLWECLSGQRLFKGATDAQVMDAVRRQPIVPVSLVRPRVPPELEDITMRALSRDRLLRYQSAFEMFEALDRYLAKRPLRPTATTLGKWLEGLFGVERASLKRAVGQGNDIERTLAKLTALGESGPASRGGSHAGAPIAKLPPPRAARPSAASAVQPTEQFIELGAEGDDKPAGMETSRFVVPQALFEAAGGPISVVEPIEPAPEAVPAVMTVEQTIPNPAPALAPAPSPARAGTPAKIVGAMALGAVAAIAVLMVGRGSPDATGPVPGAPGRGTVVLEVKSEPPGAQMLLDGEPTGLVTPTVVRNLRVGQTLELRLDKPGYLTAIQKIQMDSATKVSRSITLVAAGGLLKLEDLPARASVYLDDVLTDAQGPVAAPLGMRKLRIESGGQVVLEKVVEVGPGEQTIRIRDLSKTSGNNR
jgi:eukaryotic-like serine/threonine-protein kinase